VVEEKFELWLMVDEVLQFSGSENYDLKYSSVFWSLANIVSHFHAHIGRGCTA
jgi:hypothetical protein